jgi:hypothetical protein
MAMSQATLATELQNLTPTDSEAAAITALTDAYGVFAGAAAAGAATILPANVNAGKAAMGSALVGMSAPGAGAAIISAAIIAFWAAAVVPPWPPAVGGTPPPNAGLAALLPTTFDTNTSTEADLATATNAIATDMHSQAIIGGIMLIPPPPAGTPTPIL